MQEERKFIRQIVTGDYNATSVYGDARVEVHPPPISSELPERVWMVPYQRNISFFTGREELLGGLHERFSGGQATVPIREQAICGLGGVGKTQIAVEYAYRYRQEDHFVLWVNAASRETLIASYVDMAQKLQLPERDLQEQDKVVRVVLHWLATNEGWFLVVDNADDLDVVWPMLPTGSMGHILLTTRDRAVRGMESFPVEPMKDREGTLLLLRRSLILKAEGCN